MITLLLRSPLSLKLAWLRRSRGDMSVIFTLLILLLIIMGTMVIGTVAVMSLQRVRDVTVTAQALYAADTGIERAYANYIWDTDPNPGPTCPNGNYTVFSPPVAEYILQMNGQNVPCPTLDEINAGDTLCVSAVGKVGMVRRKIESDTPISCTP